MTAGHDGAGLRLVVLGAELPIRHEVHLPLVRDGRGVGVVGLGRSADRPFDADELELLGRLAAQAVVALDARGAPVGR